MSSKRFEIEDPEQNRGIAEDHFGHKFETVMLINDFWHGAEYQEHWTPKQGHAWPFAGGLVEFLVMGRVPGENVDEIREDNTAS